MSVRGRCARGLCVTLNSTSFSLHTIVRSNHSWLSFISHLSPSVCRCTSAVPSSGHAFFCAHLSQSDRLDHLRTASELAATEAANKIRYLEESARTLKAFEEQHSRTAVDSTQVRVSLLLSVCLSQTVSPICRTDRWGKTRASSSINAEMPSS
jgi:hypothetical protein